MIDSTRRSLRPEVPGWLLIAALMIVIWSMLRVVLWLDVGPQNVGWTDALLVFPLGAGFDVATLALKKLVDRVILISGDTDMIPAIKLARREGIQVVLINVPKRTLTSELIEDADLVRNLHPVP